MIVIIILLSIYILYVLSKIILYFLVRRFSKISYDGLTFVGFKYDFKNNMFITMPNSWQRNFGYGYIYDLLAPFVNIIIDTESIHFKYKDYNYLISFWKGQYGIARGGEIGIYRTKLMKVNKRTIYDKCDDTINMSFVLYDKDKKIIEVSDKTCWLAAFKLGEFSKPEDLSMHIWITFPDANFLKSFLWGLNKTGYKENEYRIIGNTLVLNFNKPKTKKVFTRNAIREYFVQRHNKNMVLLYNDYLKKHLDENRIDDSKSSNYIVLSKFINNTSGDSYE